MLRSLVFPVVLLSLVVNAQQKEPEPLLYFQFEQPMNAIWGINPASISTSDILEFYVGNQIYVGAFSSNQQYYLHGAYKLSYKTNSRNTIGLNFQGDKEGDLLSRNRINISYAWGTKITKKFSLAAGAAAGMMNYSIKQTSTTPAGTSYAFDGHIGIWLWSDNVHFGVSVNQITDGELQPFEQRVPLVRHYRFVGGKTFKITTNFNLDLGLINALVPNYKNQWDIILKGKHKVGVNNQKVVIGTVFKARKKLVLLVGVQDFHLNTLTFGTNLSYSYPIGQTTLDLKLYEINLNVKFKSNQEKNL